MNFFRRLFERKNVLESPSLPSEFNIIDLDISEYFVMNKGEKTDPTIAEYQDTERYRNLSLRFNDLDYQAIVIKNVFYDNNSIDSTLGINDSTEKTFLSPSKGIAVMKIINKNSDMTVGSFFSALSSVFVRTGKVKYEKGKVLEFTSKDGIDERNIEMTFISNVEDRGVNSILDYLKQEKKREYMLGMFSGYDSKIIVQDLSVDDEQMLMLMAFSKALESGNFTELALSQYEKFSGKISYIGVINGVLVIKGTDSNENTIFTTLKEEELTERMRKLPRNNEVKEKL